MNGDDTQAMSSDDRLVYMVNQIARNMATMSGDGAMDAVADHITSFWDPRMRARIAELASRDGSSLSPTAAAAVARLSKE